MLKQRLLTAAVLIPLIILAILYLPSIGFLAILVLASVLAAWEWLTMTGMKSALWRSILLLLVVLISLGSLPLVSSQNFFLALLTYWLAITAFVLIFAHKALPNSLDNLLQNKVVSFVLMAVTLSGFIYSGLWLHGLSGVGPQMVIYLLFVVWLMDTGGYFFGKRFGQRKLATAISPNKTWEGLAGGVLLATLAYMVSVSVGLPGDISAGVWFLITMATALVSVVGDLFESLFKRSFHIKDSGQLLPGHGGMLDRIDSLLAAGPVFAAGLYLAGIN